MNARDGSATRSEAATSAAAPALARWKWTDERAGVAGCAALVVVAGGCDGASLRAPRMAMAASRAGVFQSELRLFRLLPLSRRVSIRVFIHLIRSWCHLASQ